MKTKILPIPVWVMLASALLAASAPSQVGTGQPVVLALSVAVQGPDVVRIRRSGNTTTSAVRRLIVFERFSNREFLEDLQAQGRIADIRGWSIVRLTNPAGSDLGFFITRPGVRPIDVNDRLALTLLSDPLVSSTETSVERANTSQLSRSSVERSLAAVRISTSTGQLNARGIFSDSSLVRRDANNNLLVVRLGASLDFAAGTFTPSGTAGPNAAQPGLVEGFVRMFRGLSVPLPLNGS
jgi:hypothetical protein